MGWGRKHFCARCREQLSLAVELLQSYALSCSKESEFSLSRTKYICRENHFWFAPFAKFPLHLFSGGQEGHGCRGTSVPSPAIEDCKHYGRWWVSVRPAALWETNRSCWLLECYKTKQKLWRPTLDAQIRWWLSVPPHACTCGQEPVVFVYSHWEAISGSQPPPDRTASWSNLGHQGGAKHARV